MKLYALFFSTVLVLGFVSAQTPAPIVVPAVPAPPVQVATATQPVGISPAALQTVQSLKAANDDILKKQTATLQQLDELQKAVEQLKVYSKRG